MFPHVIPTREEEFDAWLAEGHDALRVLDAHLGRHEFLVGDSFGVAIAGAIIPFTGWHWLDPVVSIVLSMIILASTWALLKASMNLVLDAVPESIDPARVKGYLAALEGVTEVHDLNIWAMSTTQIALTAHLLMPHGSCPPQFFADVSEQLRLRFGIDHSTLQVESTDAPDPCKLAPEDTV